MFLKVLKGFFAGLSAQPTPGGESVGAQDLLMGAQVIFDRTRALQYRREFDNAGEMIERFLASAGSQLDARARGNLLIEAGYSRLRRYRLQEASALFKEAGRYFPEHPLIGKISQLPALVKEQVPIKRKALPPMGAAHPGEHRLTAVYFFLDTPTTTDQARGGYFELMRRSIASVKSAVPGANAVLITDNATRVNETVGFDAVFRENLDARELVHARLVAISQLLGSDRIPGNIVLLDPDTVVLRDFREIFELEFDLGFTVRSNFVEIGLDHEPINVGVIFVREPGATRARSFFQLCLQYFTEIEGRGAFRQFYPEGIRAWYGDQVLPAAIVGWRDFFEHVLSGRTDRIQVEDCTVGFFDSRLYNCSQPLTADRADSPFILHYKGQQKARMLQDSQVI